MSCFQNLKPNYFTQDQLEEAFSRAQQVDEYKHNVRTEHVLDLPAFNYFNRTGAMHDQVQFILYSEEAMRQWNIGNYVYPHKDGAKELDPFHVSLVAPMKNYQHSMIRWFVGNDEENRFETLRTGRFMKNFEDYKNCKLVDSYTFSDDKPVLFRVDVWHDVLIPFPGRKIMRWLFKQNYRWEQALKTFDKDIVYSPAK